MKLRIIPIIRSHASYEKCLIDAGWYSSWVGGVQRGVRGDKGRTQSQLLIELNVVGRHMGYSDFILLQTIRLHLSTSKIIKKDICM